MLALLVAAIFPTGGEVPPTPTIWISADEVPAISVRTADGPVVFRVDEMKVEHGIHRIAIIPQLDIGATFTVTAGTSRAAFEVVDGERHGEDRNKPDLDVTFERLSVVHRGNADVLVVDAVSRRGTVMYLLDQGHAGGTIEPGYLWIGEGTSPHREPTFDPAASLEQTRFEIPLADFGVSCASQATVSFSPYTAQLDGSATLYPIATFVVDRGKIQLPMTILGDSDHTPPWLPCPGASADAPPPAPALPSAEPPPAAAPAVIAAPEPAPAPPVEPEPTDSASIWLTAIVVLLGGLLVMWRATSRTGA